MRHTLLFLALVGLLSTGLAGCFGDMPGATDTDDDGVERAQGAKAVEHVPPGNYSFDADFSQVIAKGAFDELPFEHTIIASELDGVDIEIGVWRPDMPDGEQVPIILQASPYYGNLGQPMEKKPGIVLSYVTNFVQHGYAVAAVSVRGTGASGGCMDLMGVKEIADLDQAVTWLAEQPWTDGNIGMIGLSYDGSTPWSVAATGNPALKTIVPISGVPDVYGLMFRNGSAESRGPILLNFLYYTFFVRAYFPDFPPNEVPIYAVDKSLEGAICPESFEGFGAAIYSGATGDRDALGWWAERNRIPLVNENYKGSVFSIQGMQDWNVDPHMVIPWVDQLNESGLKTKQLLGQWGHAYPDSYCANQQHPAHDTCRWDWAEILFKWFDSELKGLPVETGPAVQVQDHTMRWRSEDHYPPRDADWATYHLANGQRLEPEPGAAGEVLLTASGLLSEDNLISDEDTRSQLPGYKADFTTDAFANDTLIAGLPRLHVTVTPHGPGGHLAAHLYDVSPQGDETLVGWTQINLAFADGTENMQTVVPNQPLLAKMEFQPMDAFIERGHSLRVRVWESTYSDRLPTIPPSPVTLEFGGQVTSILEIPAVDRDPSAFFTPPFPEGDPALR